MSIHRLVGAIVFVQLLSVAGSDVCSHAGERASPVGTAEEVLAAYEASCAAITSFDVVAEVTTESVLEPIRGKPRQDPLGKPSPTVWKKAVSPAARRRVSRQRYREGKFRLDCMEIDGKTYPEDSLVRAWNTEVCKQLSLSDRSGSVDSYARTQVSPFGLAYQDLFLTFDGEYTFGAFIRDRRRTCERDGSCLVLTAHPARESKIRASGFGLRLHLDPARGFMPTRGAYLLDDDPWPQCEWSNELYEPSPGIWVPRAGTVQVILRDKDSPFAGTPMGKVTLAIDLKRSQFNTSIDAAVFNIDFPPGLTVLDNVKGKRFVSGPDGTAAHLLTLVDPAKGAMNSFEEAPRPLGSRKVVFLSLNAIVLAAILALWWWGRRTRANQG